MHCRRLLSTLSLGGNPSVTRAIFRPLYKATFWLLPEKKLEMGVGIKVDCAPSWVPSGNQQRTIKNTGKEMVADIIGKILPLKKSQNIIV